MPHFFWAFYSVSWAQDFIAYYFWIKILCYKRGYKVSWNDEEMCRAVKNMYEKSKIFINFSFFFHIRKTSVEISNKWHNILPILRVLFDVFQIAKLHQFLARPTKAMHKKQQKIYCIIKITTWKSGKNDKTGRNYRKTFFTIFFFIKWTKIFFPRHRQMCINKFCTSLWSFM